MDDVAVVLVQDVVQVARERGEPRLRQRGDVRPGVVDRHDRVVLAVHEEHGHGLTDEDSRLQPGDGPALDTADRAEW